MSSFPSAASALHSSCPRPLRARPWQADSMSSCGRPCALPTLRRRPHAGDTIPAASTPGRFACHLLSSLQGGASGHLSQDVLKDGSLKHVGQPQKAPEVAVHSPRRLPCAPRAAPQGGHRARLSADPRAEARKLPADSALTLASVRVTPALPSQLRPRNGAPSRSPKLLRATEQSVSKNGVLEF